jgi:hypothetical protein
MNFFKIVFIDFIIFNIEPVKNYNYRLLQYFPTWFFSFRFFCYDFFQNFLYSFYFLNIKLIKNLIL